MLTQWDILGNSCIAYTKMQEFGRVDFLSDKKKCIIITALISAVSSILFCLFVHWFTMSDTEKLLHLLRTQYAGEIDFSALEAEAASGMFQSLDDPYSFFMNEEEYAAFMEDLDSLYIGIGVEVQLVDNQMIVKAPIPDSPAANAGILAGDIILKIDAITVTPETYTDAVAYLRQADNSEISVTILRGAETISLSLQRDTINVKTVTHTKYEDIGYIRIRGFDNPTLAEFKVALQSLKDCRGLVIDVRDNPGGLLDSVTEIADLLLPECTIAYTENKNGKRTASFKSDAECVDMPLVLLINENSASASEILAGTLKDNKRATLVGNKTYGKGSVQKIFPLKNGAAKFTIARYFTPSDYVIDKNGVIPDYTIQNTDKEDLQLQKAISLARQQTE